MPMPKQSGKYIFLILLATLLLPGATAGAEAQRENPFSLPAGVEFKGRTLPSPGDLKLQAVLEGKTRRIATINNQNFFVGDWVEGREILEIRPDRVILAEGTQRLELKIKRRPFSIRVTPALQE